MEGAVIGNGSPSSLTVSVPSQEACQDRSSGRIRESSKCRIKLIRHVIHPMAN